MFSGHSGFSTGLCFTNFLSPSVKGLGVRMRTRRHYGWLIIIGIVLGELIYLAVRETIFR